MFKVKAASKLSRQFMAVFALTATFFVSGFTSTAHAATARERAMHNAERISTLLHGVLPSQMAEMVKNISSGKVKTFAPEQPVWILQTDTGNILYYQGNADFAGQPASKLVDDNGVRFGQKALDSANNSKSTWLTLTLAGKKYPAFCSSWYPTIVCSLAMSK
jgi:hypothetical protein